MTTELLLNTSDPRDQKTYYLHVTTFKRILVPLAHRLFTLIAEWKVEGIENIPMQGAFVLAANHVTNMDVFFMQFSLPRPIIFMGKEELFRNPVSDWVLRQLGGFPVYRGERDQWAIRYSEYVLENDKVLGIFPEGTRNRGRGLRPAKTGMARLAQSASCPIVPVAIQGTQHLFTNLPKRAFIQIQFGTPIYPQARETIPDLTERVMFNLADMLPLEARGVYGYHTESC